MEFKGYRRNDGRVGTRNYVGILSMVVCANEVTDSISRQIQGTTPFLHQQGCCQTPVDIKRVNEVLIGLSRNPNLASVLLISLGCESTSLEDVAKMISETGKRVETIVIQDVGGAAKSIAEGMLLAQDMVQQASKLERVSCPVSDLILGLQLQVFVY
jgi:altronate dehydratase large subunit